MRVVISGCLMCMAVLAGCQSNGAQQGEVDAGPMRVGPEAVAVVRQKRIETGPRLSGSIEPREQAAVRSETAGALVAVKVELGQPVKKGEVLARIEDRSQRDALASAESGIRAAEREVEVARRQLERTRTLVRAGALARRELELAEAAVAAAQARRDQARAGASTTRKQADATVVLSPMDGIISRKQVNAGDVVAPGAELFTVIDPDDMRLEASVSSDQVSELAVGKPVSFEIRGYPGQTFQGKIERISPAADPVTRQIPLLVAIPNVNGKLVSGLFAEGRVTSEAHEGRVVPKAALTENGDLAHVMRVSEGRTERVDVKVGVRDELAEEVEVSGPLAPGDQVLVGPARRLAPGTDVELTDPAEADER